MNTKDSSAHPTATEAGARRDRALRLRKRLTAGIASGAIAAVAGFGVLAEHTVAGTRQSVATAATSTGSGASAASSSDATSSNDSTSVPSSNGSQGSVSNSVAPSSTTGRASIVSGGS